MKTNVRYRFGLWFMLLLSLFSMIPASVFAASNSAKLGPATGSQYPGASFPVSVDGTVSSYWWGGGPNSANGTITFPANLLRVVSVDDKTGASFPYSTTTFDNNAGKIVFSQNTAQFSYLKANSNVHLLTITFQTVAPGTASVQFSSMQYSTGSAATTGATYTVKTPPTPSPSPTPSPTPKPSTSPKPSTTPKPSATPTPTPSPSTTPTPEETPTPTNQSDGGIKIQDVKITTTRKENRVAWTTNATNATVTFIYGTALSAQTLKSDVSKDDDGFSVNLGALKPGTLYYFTIKVAAQDNLQGATYKGTLTTKGYPVQLTIQQNNLLIPGAKVKIGERSFVADSNAIVTTELPEGEQTAEITPPDSSSSYTVKFVVAKKTIPASGNPELQSFTLNSTTVGSSTDAGGSLIGPIIIGAVAVLVVIGSIVGFTIMRRRRPQDPSTEVDADLLMSNYGQNVSEYRQNTPDPNLETADVPHPVSPEPSLTANTALQPDVSAPLLQQELQTPAPAAPAALPTMQVQPEPTPISPEQLPVVPAPQNPSVLPLPPTEPAQMPEAQPIPDPTSYSEEQQLSPELNKIEASHLPVADEPSAVYHSNTGELEIIHHNNQRTTPPANSSSTPTTPSQNPPLSPSSGAVS